MSTTGLGEYRSRLRAVPPGKLNYDGIFTSEGHILSFTEERIRPEGNLSNYTFQGNNSIVTVIESASHLLDVAKSFWLYRVCLRDNGSNVNTANLPQDSGRSAMDRTQCSEGPAAFFRQMYLTVAGTVVEDFRRLNLCHSIVEDATIDSGYRHSMGMIENLGNLIRRQQWHYTWAKWEHTGNDPLIMPNETSFNYTSGTTKTGGTVNAFSLDYGAILRRGKKWSNTTTFADYSTSDGGILSSAIMHQNYQGQMVQFNPMSGILQHSKVLPCPIMGPIRTEFVLENPDTCMISSTANTNLWYEIKDFEFIAKWIEPDYDLMRTIVAQVKRPGGILLPYSTFIHNQATLGTSDRQVTVRLYSGPARAKSSFTTFHRTDQLTKKDRDYLKNYPFAQHNKLNAGKTGQDAINNKIDKSSYPVSVNWRVGAQTYPRQPITLKDKTAEVQNWNVMGLNPDVLFLYTEFQKVFGLFKTRSMRPRIVLENYGSMSMQGARIIEADDTFVEGSGYCLEYDENREDGDGHMGVYSPEKYVDDYYIKMGLGATSDTKYLIDDKGASVPAWIQSHHSPGELCKYKGKFIAAMNYEADSSNPHFGGVNLGPGAELNLDLVFNQAVNYPLTVHTFVHVDQVLNLRPNGAHQILK